MKIRKMTLENHPLLGDLALDFTDGSGNAVNTVIFAGENGSGKSLLLNTIFELSSHTIDSNNRKERRHFELELSVTEIEALMRERDLMASLGSEPLENPVFLDIDYSVSGNWDQNRITFRNKSGGLVQLPGHTFGTSEGQKIIKCVFSDVEINFTPDSISTVTSRTIDSNDIKSQRSNSRLATEITQLLVDIQTEDALEFSEWGRSNPGKQIDPNMLDRRIRRFADAFQTIFPKKRFARVQTGNGRKEVVFVEDGREMTIEKLSSGEKQIVFRGGFLLRDKLNSRGALVLVDEPELSLHPTWQLRIVSFLRALLTEDEVAVSQLFVATHSPFVVHNSRRIDDKVLILKKSEDGKVVVSEEPRFFGWTREQTIFQAFNISGDLKEGVTTIFVEGETDEIYLRKTIELFSIPADQVAIKWIGYRNQEGNPENTGDTALNQAYNFFRANPNSIVGKVILLYDSDTNKSEHNFRKLYVFKFPINRESQRYKIGIENLLILPDSFSHASFYKERKKVDQYGAESSIRELDKVALCSHITEKLDVTDAKKCLEKLSLEIVRILRESEI